MRGKTKVMGLALVAAFAMSAVGASVASAEKPAEFTATKYPVVVTGHEHTATDFFAITGGAARIECDNVTYEATLKEGSTSLTVTPHFTECEEAVSGNPFVVHLNGCHFEFTAGTYTTTGDLAHGSVHVRCPAGKKIELTALAFGSPICAVDIGPQTINAGITYTNIAGGGATPQHYVTVDVNVDNEIDYTERDLSFFCPNTNNHTTGDGDFVSSVRFKGYEDTGTHGTTVNAYTHNSKEVGIDVRATP